MDVDRTTDIEASQVGRLEVRNRFSVAVAEQSQVGEARRRSSRLAELLGFNEVAIGRIAIVASELGTNLVKHTKEGGYLVIQQIDGGMEILSLNKGPGLSSPEKWLQDGYSTANTLGTGLGAVKRMSSTFDLYSEYATGTAILAQFFVVDQAAIKRSFDIGSVGLPKDGAVVCGDTAATVLADRDAVMIVCDGLGHGIEAAEASVKAIKIFRESPLIDPATILNNIHRGLKGTRGAAVSIARIDPKAERLVFCGIGNVSAVIVEGSETRRHLVPDNGTAGFVARKIRAVELPWTQNSMLIMHTDGLSSSWNLQTYAGILKHRAAIIAGTLHRDFGKPRDDQTVWVLKNIQS